MTDISPEAVERLAEYCRHVPGGVSATLRALSAALTQSRAETAAVIELAATAIANVEQFTRWKKGKWKGATAQGILLDDAQNAIRALATPDQSSALAAIEAAAEARGMRKAITRLADVTREVDGSFRLGKSGFSNPMDAAEYAIIAAIPQGKK